MPCDVARLTVQQYFWVICRVQPERQEIRTKDELIAELRRQREMQAKDRSQ